MMMMMMMMMMMYVAGSGANCSCRCTATHPDSCRGGCSLSDTWSPVTHPQVHARVVHVCLCAWVADETSLVQLLSKLHDALTWAARHSTTQYSI
jgi:hypothetical protein